MQEGRYLQSDALLDSIEHDISATRESLRSTAAEILGEARGEVARARSDGIPVDAADQMLKDAETSYSDARYGDTVYAGKAWISEFEELAQANADSKRQSVAEETRIKLERMEGIHRRMELVRSDITDLVAQNLDLARAATTLSAAEQAIERGSLDEADHLVASAEGIVEGVKVTLNGQATDALQRTRKAVEVADGEGIEVDEFRTAVAQAETDLKAGRPGAVLQAIGQIDRLVSARRRTGKKREPRRALERARTAATKFIAVKKLIEDLRKGDIDITGAEERLRAAERALEKRNFDDVDAILTTLDATAKELMDELIAAAKNLIGRAERKIKEGREKGIQTDEAVALLDTAEAHLERGEYADAVEHARAAEQKSVDALKIFSEQATESRRRAQDAARARIGAIRKTIGDLSRADISILGADEALARADAAFDSGRFGEVAPALGETEEMAAALSTGLESAANDLVTFASLIEDGLSLGLSPEELDEYRAHAQEAAAADDIEEVYRLKGDLQERLLEAKRKQIVNRSMDEIRSLEEIVTQSEQLDIPAVSARSHLDAARKSIESGDVDGFHRGLADARAAIEETRTKRFIEKYETRVHSVSTMIANAKKLGAELGDAENSLNQAEAALRGSDMAMADILIKQAEGSIGMQIQNFIKNRYPNLALRVQSAGLQVGEWNQYTFEIENRGKLPARNVQVELSGDLEAKGVMPIAEIGVGEVMPVRVGVRPKAAGAIPVGIGISYQRLFDENRYEVKDTREIKVEPEATYLVEDVFLIHSDGRLIAHYSRKFREEIDEDIFSGMLTVVQDFVKDSFKSRSRVGMKRLDFGDSKILIERSPHTFLATVVVGQEPKLLPLYMLQVLKEVEDRYGTVLEKWTGLLHQLDGIDDVIKKLVLVAKDPSADIGALADSPITLTAKVIEALGTTEAIEANELMAKAQSTLETDIQLAWQFIEKAR